MDKTEFMERLKKAAELQAAKKAEQQEKVKAIMEKMRARSAQAPAKPPAYEDDHDLSGLLGED
jgi:hypothetical protein